MKEDDNPEGFRNYLRELRSDQIKTQLSLGQIVHPVDRALAELELERRQAECALEQTQLEYEDCSRQLHNANRAKRAGIALAWAAVFCDGLNHASGMITDLEI